MNNMRVPKKKLVNKKEQKIAESKQDAVYDNNSENYKVDILEKIHENKPEDSKREKVQNK